MTFKKKSAFNDCTKNELSRVRNLVEKNINIEKIKGKNVLFRCYLHMSV